MEENIIKTAADQEETTSETEQIEQEENNNNFSLGKEEAPEFNDLDLDQVDEVIRDYEQKKRESECYEDNKILNESIQENKTPKKEEADFDEFFFNDMMSLEFQHPQGTGSKPVPVEKNFKRKPIICLEPDDQEEIDVNKEKKIMEGQPLVTIKGPFKKLAKSQTDFL